MYQMVQFLIDCQVAKLVYKILYQKILYETA